MLEAAIVLPVFSPVLVRLTLLLRKRRQSA
jgi:hypothetical protein